MANGSKEERVEKLNDGEYLIRRGFRQGGSKDESGNTVWDREFESVPIKITLPNDKDLLDRLAIKQASILIGTDLSDLSDDDFESATVDDPLHFDLNEDGYRDAILGKRKGGGGPKRKVDKYSVALDILKVKAPEKWSDKTRKDVEKTASANDAFSQWVDQKWEAFNEQDVPDVV